MIKYIILFTSLLLSFSVFSQGFNKSNTFYNDANFIKITRSIKPPAKSLMNYTAPIHDQAGSSCVTHAISQGMTILNSIRRKSDLQKNNMTKSFSPYFVYINLQTDFNAGLNMQTALNYVLNNGNPLITRVEYTKWYPFTDIVLDRLDKMEKQKSDKAYATALNYKLKNQT